MDNVNLPQDAASGPIPNGELPDRLRVHTLARALGVTSKQVIEALVSIDGRTRNVQSSVNNDDAIKVRDMLWRSESGAPATQEPASQPVPVQQASDSQSMLDLGNPEPERPAYMPLFVAPQPHSAPSSVDESDVDESDVDEQSDGGAVVADVESGDGPDAEESDLAEGAAEDDDEQGDRPAAKRRRRGRRGRGRGRGDQAGPEGADDVPGESEGSEPTDTSEGVDEDVDAEGDSDGEDSDEDGATSDTANRRRRRRRRRKSGAADDADGTASPDDPPNTVVHERPARTAGRSAGSSNSEIKGIDGSTRLEAKRQRRRDGRDAGRRRPPVLTEAEFLARRESVERVMVVRDRVRSEPPHPGARYTQIAVLEDGMLVEHFVTSAASASMVGNIYLGIVQNVLPSMEAAFVDIGRGRNGVLYAGEVNWDAAGLGGADRKIEQALKPGDYIVVQVSKDPVGHKGARLTTQVSLAGRYLVYVPGASSTGISRKLPDTERQRLKEILREVVPADAGVIIRTASEGVKEEDIRGDVTRLQQHWTEIEAKAVEIKGKAAGAAVALYEEPDVLVKVIRDLFNEDFANLIVSGADAWETIHDYVSSVAPDLVSKLTRYDRDESTDGVPLPDVFAVHRIDEQLAKAMDRKVWLPSGGTLVIDRTEAMTVIDVNTGKFTGSGGNLEQTVTKNNLESAEEIVRQLRLRDIGGIIVIDFIDMVLESNRDLVLRRLTEALGRDRTRHQVSEVTSLGLVQLTRKRLGTGLIEAFSSSCPHCAGRGIVLHADPVDAAPAAATGRKPEPAGTGRRNRRAKKPRTEEVQVAKVPVHAPGEHPMFKAMAASTGGDEAGDDGEDFDEIEDGSSVVVVDEVFVEDIAAEDLAAEDDDLDDDLEDSDDEDSDEDSDDDSDDDDEDDLDDDSEDDADDDDFVDDDAADDDLEADPAEDAGDDDSADDAPDDQSHGDEASRDGISHDKASHKGREHAPEAPEAPEAAVAAPAVERVGAAKAGNSVFGRIRRRRTAGRPAGPPAPLG